MYPQLYVSVNSPIGDTIGTLGNQGERRPIVIHPTISTIRNRFCFISSCASVFYWTLHEISLLVDYDEINPVHFMMETRTPSMDNHILI